MVKRLVFAVPGDLATPTGGYAFDRRIIAELEKLQWTIEVIDLGSDFPWPAKATREHAAARPWAAPLEQVVGQIFDMGAQLVLLNLRGRRFGVGSFAQQRAVFRHNLVECRARRRGHATPAAAPRAPGTAAAALTSNALFHAALLLDAAF